MIYMKYYIKNILIFLLSFNIFSYAMKSEELLPIITKIDDISYIPAIFLMKKDNDGYGETVLHLACKKGDFDTVTKIFSRKDMNPCELLFLTDINGYLPIDKAAENNHVSIIQ